MVIKFFATFQKLMRENGTVIPESVDFGNYWRFSVTGGPGFQKKFFLSGGLHQDVILLINGRTIEYLRGLSTPLKPSDVISIFPRMAGGESSESECDSMPNCDALDFF